MHREYDRSYIYRSLYTVPSRLQFPLPPVLFMMQSLHLQSVFSIIPGNTALNFLPAISTISTFNISFTWSAIFATFLPGSSQPLYYLIISAHVISFLSLFLFVYSLWALTFFYGVLRELSIVVLILTGRLFTHILLTSHKQLSKYNSIPETIIDNTSMCFSHLGFVNDILFFLLFDSLPLKT